MLFWPVVGASTLLPFNRIGLTWGVHQLEFVARYLPLLSVVSLVRPPIGICRVVGASPTRPCVGIVVLLEFLRIGGISPNTARGGVNSMSTFDLCFLAFLGFLGAFFIAIFIYNILFPTPKDKLIVDKCVHRGDKIKDNWGGDYQHFIIRYNEKSRKLNAVATHYEYPANNRVDPIERIESPYSLDEAIEAIYGPPGLWPKDTPPEILEWGRKKYPGLGL
jgi:hypothetical protein